MKLDKLDKVFSEYIRRRDADEFGRVKCCTCDAVAHWAEMDAGHFVSRKHMSTRWKESNCHPQCRNCNRLAYGASVEYLMYMKERYGYEEASIIVSESQVEKHWMQHEIDELVIEYKEKIKALWTT